MLNILCKIYSLLSLLFIKLLIKKTDNEATKEFNEESFESENPTSIESVELEIEENIIDHLQEGREIANVNYKLY